MTDKDEITTDGYSFVDNIFNRIGLEENHEISIEDMIKTFSFWGLNEEAPKTGRIGFVCDCARYKLKKIIEQALVYGDYVLIDEFIKQIKEKENKEMGESISTDIDSQNKDEYRRGLEDAWNIARKIELPTVQDGLDNEDLRRIFNISSTYGIFEQYSIHQVMEKIAAYEEDCKKCESIDDIKVGDEVKIDLMMFDTIYNNDIIYNKIKSKCEKEYTESLYKDKYPYRYPYNVGIVYDIRQHCAGYYVDCGNGIKFRCRKMDIKPTGKHFDLG